MFNPPYKKKNYIDLSGAKKNHPSFDSREGNFSCPSCSAWLSEAQKIQNNDFCPRCSYYFTTTAWERIYSISDENSFEEWDANLSTLNPLEFPGYEDKLAKAKEETVLSEAIITGTASIGGFKTVLAAMDARFMMGSMGSVVGEKICRAMEKAIFNSLPFIIFCCSGGARMQEGMLSLMQMAKTSAAVGRLNDAGLLYISILTHPTTGGVTASFASLADIIIAEPGALIGFTGPRVIQQTLGEKLPPGFQRSEYLLQHGMIDIVQPRLEMRSLLIRLLNVHQGGNHA
ncbi:MAG: acetyl-CoA carboxylase carboxyl transferase subunit beta [Firmicutes bacterium HGW-Firmicutes-15]|nr:MAG: acetyl-CoA carboxylase carboxyl transferase subunit beta [Firmicutes bacterium HGW-Firmicutes-15]